VTTNTDNLAAWQWALRKGIFPQISDRGLAGLKAALERGDARVIQGTTTVPSPLQSNRDSDLEACCPTCWMLLNGDPPVSFTVSEMDDQFFRLCVRAGRLLGEPGAAKHFLNWVDDTDSVPMRRDLLVEVMRELAERQAGRRPLLCSSCGSCNITGELPAVDDENAWRRLALDHEPRCLWVKTRGGQLKTESIYYTPQTPLAQLLHKSIEQTVAKRRD
jgi:hypothetical protein